MSQRHVDVRIELEQRGQQRPQAQRLRIDDRPQAQHASDVAAQGRRQRGHLLRPIHHAPRDGQQAPARRRDGHAGGGAVEQQHAQFILQALDLLGDGGLREMQLLARATELAGASNGEYRLELIEFHVQGRRQRRRVAKCRSGTSLPSR